MRTATVNAASVISVLAPTGNKGGLKKISRVPVRVIHPATPETPATTAVLLGSEITPVYKAYKGKLWHLNSEGKFMSKKKAKKSRKKS